MRRGGEWSFMLFRARKRGSNLGRLLVEVSECLKRLRESLFNVRGELILLIGGGTDGGLL
jgi:hypothetical protein